MINLPVNCITPPQRLSYAIKLLDIVIKKHNADGYGTTPDMLYKLKQVSALRNKSIALAVKENYHSMGVGSVVNNIITFPPSVNTANEGARLVALYSLSYIIDIYTSNDFQIKMGQAKTDAINGTFWNPTIEDII